MQVILGGRDVTSQVDQLSFSNSDPGGFEMCQLTLRDALGVLPGARVTVYDGSAVAWDGRVNEVGDGARHGRYPGQVSAVGHAAALSDRPYTEVYVDRDLSHWRPPSRARTVSLQSGATKFSTQGGSAQILGDTTSGIPALVEAHTRVDSVLDSRNDLVETWYDSAGIALDRIFFDQTQFDRGNGGGQLGAGWQVFAAFADSDDATGFNGTSNLAGTASAAYHVAATTAKKYALVQMYLNGTFTQDGDWKTFWRKLAVYGRHGLVRRGDDPGGFYPSDIARHALSKAAAGIVPGVVGEAFGFTVPHAVYRQPTMAAQVIDDMAKLMGWHWGVWEPASLLDGAPRWWFTPRPLAATVTVARSECDQLDPPKYRLDHMYDTAQVAYRDASGSVAVQTVTLTNPLLARSRTLILDMGVGSSAAASTFGRFALLLSQRAARGGGSCVVPTSVRVAAGSLPATLLKAGRDRIRITDLPDVGSVVDSDTRRFDTFHVRRVETTVDPTGAPRTRVEFDGGADLLEVLQARLSTALTITGG